MKKNRLILNIIAVFLTAFQVLGYVGSIGKPPTKAQGIDLAAYYLGFNLPAVIALILFLISLNLKRQMKKKEMSAIIDSIGKS